MRTLIIALILFATVSTSHAAVAFWTGRMEQIQTATYQIAWQCEYNYLGQTFWRVFTNSCPANVEVY